ncbi:MAG TPA: NlpC/P60 family protein [Xanthobacteraceae bacterium]|nr:NlpC/P60 family protein [Xanthobacteraceae bacterium]
MSAFDPRLTPARPDLAAAHLRGKVEAARFVEGVTKRVVSASAPLRRRPEPDAPLDTEALHGERVTIYETNDEGWSWGQLERDGYVGWLPASELGDEGPPPTHRVSALRTLVFRGPDIKQPPLASLSLGSRVFVARIKGEFAVSEAGGFIPARHLAPLAEHESDFVAVAERFIGTPYLWGGRSSLGLDCSGLVQVALQAAGIECPRDSDMQAAFGSAVPFSGDTATLRRGDLVCWKRHIGIVSAPGRLLHANAFHMAVADEPLDEAIERIRGSGLEVTTVRRPGSGWPGQARP